MVETVRRQPVLDEAAGRYVVIEDGATAVLDFKLSDGRLSIEHVVVPDAISGRGIGGELVASAVARANDEHRTVAPRCPFARRWLRRNPDARSFLDRNDSYNYFQPLNDLVITGPTDTNVMDVRIFLVGSGK